MTDTKKYRWLTVMLISCNTLFFGAKKLIIHSGSNSYMTAIACSVICALLYYALFSQKGINCINLSKKISRIVFSLLTITAFVQSVSLCSYSANAITEVFMKKSPFPYVLLFTALPVITGGYYGLKSVSRYARAGGIIIFFLVALVLAFAYSEYNVKNLCPIFGNGTENLYGALYGILLFSSIIYLYIILLTQKTNLRRARTEATKNILISGALLSAVCLCTNLCVPYPALETVSNPVLYIASNVNFSFLVERCEAIVFFIWIFTVFISLSALLCFLQVCAQKAFDIKNIKALNGAFAGAVFFASLIADKYGEFDTLMNFSIIWTGCTSVILPIILNIIGGIKR